MALPENAPPALVRCLGDDPELADAFETFASSGAPRLDAANAGKLVAALGDIPTLLRSLFFLAEARARAPISRFRAGAVARGTSGAIYLGANLELPGAPVAITVHAEQAAAFQAFLAGEEGLTHLGVGASPCGGCRQFLGELVHAEELILVLPSQACTLPELLPGAFRPEDLGVSQRWMGAEASRLSGWADGDPLTLARKAAHVAYAPYTNTREGLVLVAEDGRLFPGSRVESAAFNPTLTALGAALSGWSLAGAPSLTRAVHVVIEGASLAPERYAEPIVKSCWGLDLESHHEAPGDGPRTHAAPS